MELATKRGRESATSAGKWDEFCAEIACCPTSAAQIAGKWDEFSEGIVCCPTSAAQFAGNWNRFAAGKWTFCSW